MVDTNNSQSYDPTKIEEKDYDEPLGRVNKFNKQMIIDWNKKNKSEVANKLAKAKMFLELAGIDNWWVDCGTLLGTWRTNAFIPHDIDIDVAAVAEKQQIDKLCEIIKNYDKEVYRLDEYRNDLRDAVTIVYLKMDRFKIDNPKNKTGKYLGDTYEYAGNYLDIYFYIVNKDKKRVYHKFEYDENIYGAEWAHEYDNVFPLGTNTCEGIEVKVPGKTNS